MTRSLKIFQDASLLDDIQVASPCHAKWKDMVGSDTVRFCASCQKNVYNLSSLQRDEAIELLRATEGRLCVRFYRRSDGTVLSEDCPVGVRLALRRAKRATLAAAAVAVGAVAAVLAMLGGSFTKKTCDRLDDVRTAITTTISDPPPMMGAPPAMPPSTTEPVPTMGEPIAPEMGKPAPPPPSSGGAQEVKGHVNHPVMGKIAIRHPNANPKN